MNGEVHLDSFAIFGSFTVLSVCRKDHSIDCPAGRQLFNLYVGPSFDYQVAFLYKERGDDIRKVRRDEK